MIMSKNSIPYTINLNNRIYKNCNIIEYSDKLEFIHFISENCEIIAKVDNIIITKELTE